MLRLSKLTDYATVILSHMARESGRLHGTFELAEVTGIAQPTVSKILKTLMKAQVVVSVRGAKGGYALAREPDRITVAAIIGALEGPIALTECSASHKGCDQASGCRIQGNWHLINQKIANALESITLADMVLPFKPPEEVYIPVNQLFR
ncbi:SUF system Fe-S cluster assembly regulator [Methylomonas sp. EFPC3]|uniref:SUF system Fe-S cluster assembly regulator n=1 Tax=Methylomonas TaxID=416 RepID=UPI00112EF0CF|nr:MULTISPECIES: SUF system Fe-S cluster assembly regulator [Methylomonas]TPQ25530.1 SUF system Fe-S cluster assembly regulator [Methylomonas koyamae]WFP51648.1 SUF system Fe-S cluster assembly regulator [Methylomonas sp. EFPC3]